MDTQLEQVIYTSIASDTLAGDDVFRIIQQSAGRNVSREITGFLIFCNRRFFQLIEGSRASLDDLLADIGRDSRHHSISIVQRTQIANRSFPAWTMKRLLVEDSGSQVDDFLKTLETSPESRVLAKRIHEFVSAC